MNFKELKSKHRFANILSSNGFTSIPGLKGQLAEGCGRFLPFIFFESVSTELVKKSKLQPINSLKITGLRLSGAPFKRLTASALSTLFGRMAPTRLTERVA